MSIRPRNPVRRASGATAVPAGPSGRARTVRAARRAALERGIGRFCVSLAVLALLLAAINLYYIHSEPAGPPPPPGTAIATGEEAPAHQIRVFVKHQLDLDREANFTTWLSSMQLALAAMAALGLAFFRSRRRWLVVALGITYLSIDEVIGFHEMVGSLLFTVHFDLGFVMRPYPWIIVFAPVLIGFAIWMLRFLASEFPDPRWRRLALVALVLMAASLPLEAVGGYFEGTSARLLRVSSTIEETCELLGEVLLVYLLLSFLVRSALPRPRPIDVWAGLERDRDRDRDRDRRRRRPRAEAASEPQDPAAV